MAVSFQLALVLSPFPLLAGDGLFCFCAIAWTQCFAQPAQFQLLELNGPASNRISVIFLSEGYTASQSNAFALHATNALNALFSSEPFQQYRAGFNASMIFVSSQQSGSDHPALSGVNVIHISIVPTIAPTA